MNTQAPKKFKILLIGDACEDTYTYGSVTRISPEAPVPIFEPKYKIVKDGMACNVRKNLEALGCEVNYLHGEKSKKERLIDNRSKQHLLRIDRDVISEPLTQFDLNYLKNIDAVVISDYNKGYVDYRIINYIATAFSPKPIYIDTKKTDLAKFHSCYIKINQLEEARATSLPNPENLIVTHGHHGALWNGLLFSPEVSNDITDVTGAGDTFLAALVYKHLETKDMPQAIAFANQASSVTIKHVGVYAPTLEEII
jgi:D-beta-D-heptose 7-phosphate kinase/D-beta-D-heptose 1-phosphate adenosyltransferase